MENGEAIFGCAYLEDDQLLFAVLGSSELEESKLSAEKLIEN